MANFPNKILHLILLQNMIFVDIQKLFLHCVLLELPIVVSYPTRMQLSSAGLSTSEKPGLLHTAELPYVRSSLECDRHEVAIIFLVSDTPV